jgi:DNA-binding NtrC family response regulator
MAKAKLKILYGEGDEDVVKAQAAALEKAGHSVQQALGRKAVEEALKKASFDLVVLGGSLTRNDRHHLPYMVKKANTQTSVLVLHADGTRHPYVDACTDTGASIEHVLARIDSMNLLSTNLAGSKSAAAVAGR